MVLMMLFFKFIVVGENFNNYFFLFILAFIDYELKKLFWNCLNWLNDFEN